ncbi:MAG: GNAT family N-acetyltransferase [Candidatus Cloacimonetes bacterium]|nr:GNAT family N-acetyltransferase [Candidatus Cloacimonadota bacterium]
MHPELQGQGIGSMLVRHTLPIAKSMGFTVIITYGDPDYYQRFGFRPGREYGIYTMEKTYSPALIVLELQAGAMQASRVLLMKEMRIIWTSRKQRPLMHVFHRRRRVSKSRN